MGYYTVQGGDSWASIARDVMGNEREFGNLMGANNGGFALRPGTQIYIPEKSAGTPFVSNELAAATGMATSGQVAGAYNTGDTNLNQKIGMDWTTTQGQTNQLWAAEHARGLNGATGLENGMLPKAWLDALSGRVGGNGDVKIPPYKAGPRGTPANQPYWGYDPQTGAQTGTTPRTGAQPTYWGYTPSQIRNGPQGYGGYTPSQIASKPTGNAGSIAEENRLRYHGQAPTNVGVNPADIHRAQMAGLNVNLGQPTNPTLQTISDSYFNFINHISVGNASAFWKNLLSYPTSDEFANYSKKVQTNMEKINPGLAASLTAGAGTPYAAPMPMQTEFPGKDTLSNVIPDYAGLETNVGTDSGGGANVLDSLEGLLKDYGIGPEIWRLDWMSVRAGANIQPYGYERDWSGGGGGGGTQGYQQNYMYGAENMHEATG